MQAKQWGPTGGIYCEIAATESQMADRPFARVAAVRCQRCDGYTVPTPETMLYVGGLLIKLEQLRDLCNCTLGPGNSSGSILRNTKCYRIGVAAKNGRDQGADR